MGVPTKRGEMVGRYIGDGEGLGEAPTHPAWPQEQGFPLIMVHGRAIFKLKGCHSEKHRVGAQLSILLSLI